MEERTNNAELEILTKIHNQLVDLKKVLVEIELARPGTSMSLQTKLRQIVGADQHVDTEGRPGAVIARQQKVITPMDTSIEPGVDAGGKGGKQ